jgi:hypothetical protein
MEQLRNRSKALPGKKAVQYTKIQTAIWKADKAEKSRKVAWAMYYKVLEREQEQSIITYEKLVEVPVKCMDEYAEQEFIKLLIELKRNIDCPICLETIDPTNISITGCGHKYCKNCLNTLKNLTNPKCAICRSKIGRWTR